MPTLAELNAQQAALTKALAELELPLHTEAADVLAELAASPLVARLAEIVAELPDSGAKSAIVNVQAAVGAASGLISMHLPRLRQLAGVETAPTVMPGILPS